MVTRQGGVLGGARCGRLSGLAPCCRDGPATVEGCGSLGWPGQSGSGRGHASSDGHSPTDEHHKKAKSFTGFAAANGYLVAKLSRQAGTGSVARTA